MNQINVAFIVESDMDPILAIMWLVIAWMLLVVVVIYLAYKLGDKDD